MRATKHLLQVPRCALGEAPPSVHPCLQHQQEAFASAPQDVKLAYTLDCETAPWVWSMLQSLASNSPVVQYLPPAVFVAVESILAEGTVSAEQQLQLHVSESADCSACETPLFTLLGCPWVSALG
jgi:hypothetical protein